MENTEKPNFKDGHKSVFVNWIEKFIFSSRWLLTPFYIGLYIAMLVYVFFYTKEIYHFILESKSMSKDVMLLTILELVDIVMIVNLVKMVITGSYHSFVSKEHGYKNENTSSGMLKVKMSTSIVNVASMYLLQMFIQTFISTLTINWDDLKKQLLIFAAFLLGALTQSVIDYLHCKTENNH